MFPDAFIPLGQVPATAARLDRAAAELHKRAGSPHATPKLPATLAHLEDTFGELAASMQLLAEAAAEWCDADQSDDFTLPPEASALLWHLRSVAATVTDAHDGCLTARHWAQQLLEHADPEPEPGVIMNLPTAPRPSTRRIVCGVDGSEQADYAATFALRLADRLGAQLTLVHVTPTRSAAPVDRFPYGVDPGAFGRSTELAFSESEAAFTPCHLRSPRRT